MRERGILTLSCFYFVPFGRNSGSQIWLTDARNGLTAFRAEVGRYPNERYYVAESSVMLAFLFFICTAMNPAQSKPMMIDALAAGFFVFYLYRDEPSD